MLEHVGRAQAQLQFSSMWQAVQEQILEKLSRALHALLGSILSDALEPIPEIAHHAQATTQAVLTAVAVQAHRPESLFPALVVALASTSLAAAA